MQRQHLGGRIEVMPKRRSIQSTAAWRNPACPCWKPYLLSAVSPSASPQRLDHLGRRRMSVVPGAQVDHVHARRDQPALDARDFGEGIARQATEPVAERIIDSLDGIPTARRRPGFRPRRRHPAPAGPTPGRRAGGDEVARLEGHDARDEGDDQRGMVNAMSRTLPCWRSSR